MENRESSGQLGASRAANDLEAPLEAAPLEFLLDEAKDRYRSEHDRFNQTYTRAGIYLGVVAVYVNVLARLIERPLPVSSSWVLVLFRCAVGGLLFTIAGCAACVVGAILGRAVGYIPEPSSWLAFIAGQLRQFVFGAGGQLSEAGTELALELRRQTLDRYAKAIDINVRVNRIRLAWLHRCSYLVLAGLLLTALATASYAWLALSAPTPANITSPAVDRSRAGR